MTPSRGRLALTQLPRRTRPASPLPRRWQRVWGKAAADNHLRALADRRAWALETRAALGRLEADQRIVLVASYFEGQSHAEIAADLDLPVATVVATMTRAMRHLTALLAARGSITPLRGQRG